MFDNDLHRLNQTLAIRDSQSGIAPSRHGLAVQRYTADKRGRLTAEAGERRRQTAETRDAAIGAMMGRLAGAAQAIAGVLRTARRTGET